MIVFSILDKINNKSCFLNNKIHVINVVSETAIKCALVCMGICDINDPGCISRVDFSALTSIIIMKRLFETRNIDNEDSDMYIQVSIIDEKTIVILTSLLRNSLFRLLITLVPMALCIGLMNVQAIL